MHCPSYCLSIAFSLDQLVIIIDNMCTLWTLTWFDRFGLSQVLLCNCAFLTWSMSIHSISCFVIIVNTMRDCKCEYKVRVRHATRRTRKEDHIVTTEEMIIMFNTHGACLQVFITKKSCKCYRVGQFMKLNNYPMTIIIINIIRVWSWHSTSHDVIIINSIFVACLFHWSE